MIGEVYVFQKLCECHRRNIAAFLENEFDLPTNHIGQLRVKSGRCGVALDLEIELNREIGGVFSCECGKCSSKESRFSGLSGCEDDDVFSIFDACDEISSFLRTSDDVVIVGIDRPLCSKSSHSFLLLVKASVSLVYQKVSGGVKWVCKYFVTGLSGSRFTGLGNTMHKLTVYATGER